MMKNSSSSKIRKRPSTPSPQSSKPADRSIPKLELQKDLRDFVALSLSKKVEFVVVGGYATALHGAPRFTNDIDLFVRISSGNAEKLECVLREFDVSREDVSREDLLTPGQVIQIGRPPNRVDLLTSIDGVQWEEVWDSKIEVELSGLKCWMIGKELLIKNKMASGRPQDLVDATKLKTAITPLQH